MNSNAIGGIIIAGLAVFAANPSTPTDSTPLESPAAAADVAPPVTWSFAAPIEASTPTVPVSTPIVVTATAPVVSPRCPSGTCPQPRIITKPTVRYVSTYSHNTATYRRGPLGLVNWRVSPRRSSSSQTFWSRGPVRRVLSLPWRRR